MDLALGGSGEDIQARQSTCSRERRVADNIGTLEGVPAAIADWAVVRRLADICMTRRSGAEKGGDAVFRRRLHSIRGVFLGVALALAPLTGVARAQDAGATSGWSFQLTPYLWLAGING